MEEVKPKVSVIIPNYNHSRYLPRRIESVLGQDFQDFEVIMLDDASTDESAELMRKYSNHPRVACVEVNAENTRSPFRQWLKGIARARGEYIWIAESDDAAERNFLSTLVPVLDAHPDVSVAFAGSHLIDGDDNILPEDTNKWRTRGKKYAVFDGREYARHNLYWMSYISNASSALFRKEKLTQTDVSLCDGMRYAGDWLFWFKLSLVGNIAEVYEILNYFRHHGGKVTYEGKRTGNGLREDILVISEIEKHLQGLGTYKKIVRHGLLYSRIRKARVSRETKQALYDQLRAALHSGRGAFAVERVNRYLRILCPLLPTMKHDRLYP